LLEFELSDEADRDLDEIFDWWAQGSIEKASEFVLELLLAAQQLAQYPELGHPHEDLDDPARVFVHEGYYIVHRITGGVLEIARFMHGARDLRRAIPREE
jgi:toxin ParE1/3/4